MTATALGISGSSISERINTNAPSSCHSNDVRPWNVAPGTRGCLPVVRHTPTNCDSASSAGLGRCALGPIGVVIRRMLPDNLGQDRRQRFEGTGEVRLPNHHESATPS